MIEAQISQAAPEGHVLRTLLADHIEESSCVTYQLAVEFPSIESSDYGEDRRNPFINGRRSVILDGTQELASGSTAGWMN